MISLTIDGQKVEVEEGTTVLQAARKVGADIPTLCYLEDVNKPGGCRVCLVEVEGNKTFPASCLLQATEGMVVRTNTPAVLRARKQVLELLLSNHPFDCLTCDRNQHCELQRLAHIYGIRELSFTGERKNYPVDDLHPSLVREPSKCIVCRRCVSVCNKVQEVGIYEIVERGFQSVAAPAYNDSLVDTPCIACGQCIMVCPTAALHEQNHTQRVWDALMNPEMHVIIQTAPSIRVSIGEEFGMPVGTLVTGKLVTALKRLGFDKVFDDCFGADVVVMEEGHELLHRLKEGDKLPQFTACCPGWVNFCEFYYPDLIHHLSKVKSPQQVFGALAKTYYAEKAGIDPAKIFSVSVMPCVAKKFECERPEMNASGMQDVNANLTTRELAQMIKEAGIRFEELPDSEYDEPMGYASGAGVIFGSGGGVMEAALRTVYEVYTGKSLEKIEFKEIRSSDMREATIDLGDRQLRVAVARGTGAARRLIDRVRDKEAEYDFIEIMACPGACVGGGGQPIYIEPDKWKIQIDERAQRAKGLYAEDGKKKIRKSHENPFVKKLYDEFLGHPLSEKSVKLLHTDYVARELYPREPSLYKENNK